MTLGTTARELSGATAWFPALLPEVDAGLFDVSEEVRRLSASPLPLLTELVQRAVHADSKRLRSTVALTCALAAGGTIDERVTVAVASVELVHATTQVREDDWGPAAARLAGDFLLARASAAALWVSREAAEELTVAVTDLVDGRCRELSGDYDIELNAPLFRAACAMAARCAGAAEADLERFAEFGARVGTVVRSVADLLDLVIGTEPVSDDLQVAPRWGTLVTDTFDRCASLCGEALRTVPESACEPAAQALRGLPLAYLDWARSLIPDCPR